MTTTSRPDADVQRRDALAEQLFRSTIGALEVLHVYLGDRLGLYAAMAQHPDLSPSELSSHAGIAERYAREWLEQQAVAGVIDVAEDTGVADTRRYRLPAAARGRALRPGQPAISSPRWRPWRSAWPGRCRTSSRPSGPAAACRTRPTARTSGTGSPGSTGRCSSISSPPSGSLPCLTSQARLRRSDPPARVADLGCGSGWSTIALARGYPAARVDGIDLDRASIDDALRNVRDAGVADRVTFTCRDAADPELAGRYDLVTLFETLHDMAHPVQVLRAARAMLAPGGVVLVADERVAETFSAPGDELERFNYGWSAPHCLAAALVEPDSAATGTVIRPDTVRRYASDAGFSTTTVLPIEHDFWRFYRLDA